VSVFGKTRLAEEMEGVFVVFAVVVVKSVGWAEELELFDEVRELPC